MFKSSNNQGVVARTYMPSDQRACLGLFDGNVPAFFSPSERQDFEQFLSGQALEQPYQVLEYDGRVVGCGGLIIEEDGITAGLCWGMVDRQLQGMGLGSALTELRLRSAAVIPGIMQVRLDTSQHTQGFYGRFGFEALKITQDGYGPGLDRWDMQLRFDEHRRPIWQTGS